MKTSYFTVFHNGKWVGLKDAPEDGTGQLAELWYDDDSHTYFIVLVDGTDDNRNQISEVFSDTSLITMLSYTENYIKNEVT